MYQIKLIKHKTDLWNKIQLYIRKLKNVIFTLKEKNSYVHIYWLYLLKLNIQCLLVRTNNKIRIIENAFTF